MPIEALCGIQLALYAVGWALAAWLIVEERPAMLHWMAYAALQAGSVVLALPALSAGTAPPLTALLASVLGFAAAVRGLDVFVSGRARHDRWALFLLLAMGLGIAAVELLARGPALRSRWEGVPYSLGLSLMLLSYAALSWKPLRRSHRAWTSTVLLAPLWSTALLGLLSLWGRTELDDADLQAMRAAARTPNAILTMVMSGVFNIAFLVLLVGRLLTRLREGARVDHLTGVLNRRAIEERLEAAWEQHRRTGCGLAIAMMDLDHFKRINDLQGHEAGDRALALAGETLREQLRPYDSVGRWGGEEFLLIWLGPSAEGVQRSCERLREVLALRAQEQLKMPLTASFGVAVLRASDVAEVDLVRRADAALYQAKREGRDRVCLAGPAPVLHAA
ncbi:GGDEF domain-containing protein [Ideonella dechloratans]|jgi:diguanylate cyclase (GGDEF)-like protein|uniref:diguanylate cyclase n=1 Tax=Ideonella dechloratans TaxID=36863 RepID=A0A643FJ01_IDEDE|nr:GGDEF domain-containing protein [Ideonella dechloratans]KAB0584370.1 GGDEF domain-containing protein [Ideonella dechloratans]UFU10808.1 GGDEF domain-containing protein [Ideonella dechloratans]